jgi:4-hydroxythreonine-4-phosphate dehydrogenase
LLKNIHSHKKLKELILPIRIALTTGEPAGIGVDIVLMLASKHDFPFDLWVFADPDVLAERATQLGLSLNLLIGKDFVRSLHQAGQLKVYPLKVKQKVVAGQLNVANADYVLACLRQAVAEIQAGRADALVTAPVHKGIINQAGVAFSGHTEFLAELTGTPKVVMMLATEQLRVALATTHLPLSKVSQAITAPHLESVIRILDRELHRLFHLAKPRILLCGLNPHAGEDGALGREEIEVMLPVVEKLRAEGFALTHPVSADTAFTAQSLAQADVVLAMYHDQGLPVLKHQGFGQAVNITLGLPLIRISVDHGTALPLAGTGQANTHSLAYALQVAFDCVGIKITQQVL